MTLPSPHPHRLSQCAKILRVLEDHRPHLVSEIHDRAGYSRLNSRIAELRKRGLVIESFHIPGKTGSDGYGYRLLGEADGDVHGGVPPSASPSESVPGSPHDSSADGAVGAAPSPSPTHSTFKLTLEHAAAHGRVRDACCPFHGFSNEHELEGHIRAILDVLPERAA